MSTDSCGYFLSESAPNGDFQDAQIKSPTVFANKGSESRNVCGLIDEFIHLEITPLRHP
jgi:hypothetical protein